MADMVTPLRQKGKGMPEVGGFELGEGGVRGGLPEKVTCDSIYNWERSLSLTGVTSSFLWLQT